MTGIHERCHRTILVHVSITVSQVAFQTGMTSSACRTCLSETKPNSSAIVVAVIVSRISHTKLCNLRLIMEKKDITCK